MLGTGSGTFGSPTWSYINDGYTTSAIVEDFNGDGKLDIASVSDYGYLNIGLGTGTGYFDYQYNYYYVGNNPIKVVEMPVVSCAAMTVVLRPMRSPKCPNTTAPRGRAKKARAKVANDCSLATRGSSAGKNRLGNISTAAVA